MNENWKPVHLAEYSAAYFVSNLGRIKKLNGNQEKIIKPSINKYGYSEVGLWRDSKRKSALVHHLVLWAFIGNRPSPNHETRHLDNNRSNNIANNLMWGTKKENEKDKSIHYTSPIGERNGRSKLNQTNILEIRISSEKVKNIAAKYGVGVSAIYKIKNNMRWA